MKKNKGFTLIETIIAVTITIFLLFAVFYAIGSVLSGSVLTEKNVDLTDELGRRINEYIISGEFDASDDNGMEFSKEEKVNNIIAFHATNSDFGLNITKKVYENDISNDNGNGTDSENGNGSSEVTICHKPGTPAEKTMTLPASALNGHLGHGDSIGACSETEAEVEASTVVLCHKPGTPAEKTKTLPAAAVKGHLGHGDYLGACGEGVSDDDNEDNEEILICYPHNKNKWKEKTINSSELSAYKANGAYEGSCT
ncbi:prepilin-type N-terminal cleavage/methylation domain-containing protein [Francisella adeliensis]|uniref:Uncharacterized protein n=1 Tax=Francisella adeliensis TaxID=2007306 RepID=A0A2Z4XYD0_9GAMM|nr:prepilin-type N-terminal cleavage/methylation domain-containing protein [Francisella adeliensis]AXA33443.1 hypothetical protein CDH04_03000 [Francisella adeliensis]MBK2085463.1 prepilin-type N-terminal cleavage/methylation domain-containing protein [Francisella adeliensis]MBK2097193.1 prepilin-type N-terminal cleavage/methylation domain-containing protein [Francisella adeliensis]QIW11671.1 hypothetical protein FZC43_03000 [Francisella adeliensis]QIW13546.1 hypothetical protein FZC44_03000 [